MVQVSSKFNESWLPCVQSPSRQQQQQQLAGWRWPRCGGRVAWSSGRSVAHVTSPTSRWRHGDVTSRWRHGCWCWRRRCWWRRPRLHKMTTTTRSTTSVSRHRHPSLLPRSSAPFTYYITPTLSLWTTRLPCVTLYKLNTFSNQPLNVA